MMGVQSFRALRAALGIIASGYDDQAVGDVRLISELHGRARKVFEDESGEYARQWIDGRTGGSGAKVVGQDLWEVLSGPPHPTARATLDWTAVASENGPTLVVLGPERRPDLSNGTLAFIAGEIRDIGYVLATASGISGVLPESLDTAILVAHERYLPDDPGGPPGSPSSATRTCSPVSWSAPASCSTSSWSSEAPSPGIASRPMSGEYELPLDYILLAILRVEFTTRGTEVTDYAVVLLFEIEGKTETIRLYDGAHGHNEMHRYTCSTGKQSGTPLHRGTLGDGMRAAIAEIKSGYREMIEGWQGQ